MLRAVSYRSPVSDFSDGRFQSVIDDPSVTRTAVTRLVLASGKVSHEALAHRDEKGANTVGVLRVEQLYPWPAADLAAITASYPALQELVWLQEEPENMGAWPFVQQRLRAAYPTLSVRHVARAKSASPATGSGLVHAAEQADILARAIS
jgi:2-oxoglutarate dehydrogenase E1 component